MSVSSIVIVNVAQQIAPTPATLQQTGAIVSQGGTITSPGTSSLLTQLADLLPLLPAPAAIASITWSGNVATVTTSAVHNLPNGQVIGINISGSVASVTAGGYNGSFQCTITGTSTFTYPLAANPGTETIPGVWVTADSISLTERATTFFAQGSSVAVYVLECGAVSITNAIAFLANYLTLNPNSNYTPGAVGYYYNYLVPRNWDSVSSYLTLLQSYESTTARTYFTTTTTLATYTNYTALQKCVIALIESPAMGIWAQNALTAITYSSFQVTATTTTAHGILKGQWFQIQGVTPNGYNGWWQAADGTTGSTIIYNVPSALGAESVLGVLEASLYSNAGVTSNEFSAAAPFWVELHQNPSTTNKVVPYAYQFLFGVTPFPTRGLSSLIETLKLASVNIVGTGAEGGISDAILLWGTTMDGNDFLSYWYSVDWVQINLDLDTANAVINGNNNPINPLYYNQPGIDVLSATAASTMTRGITYGLVLGTVTQTSLDGNVLDGNLDAGNYTDLTVVNAVPFVTYSLENPSDYKTRVYKGMSVIYTPQNGFLQIVYNVVVTELIAL